MTHLQFGQTKNRFLYRSIVPTEGVRAKVYFKALPVPDIENGLTFLTLDQVKMDFSVKDIKMGVDNIANGNALIRKFNINNNHLFSI